MKNNIKLICVSIASFIIGSATVVCANQAIQAMQNTEIKVSLDGQVQEFKDETTGERQYPITYNNRTYLPLRNVAQLAGLDVDYDSSSNMAILKSKNSNTNEKLSFEERTMEAKEIICAPDHRDENYLEKECVVTNASLKKNDSNYIIHLTLSRPKLYDKEVVDEVYSTAQEKGTFMLDEYVFYKDNELNIEFDEDSEYSVSYKSAYDDYKKEYLLATDSLSKYLIFGFKKLKNNESKYYIDELNLGFPYFDKEVLEKDQEIDVILLPDDKVLIKIDNEEYYDKYLTVEELYNKGISEEIINAQYDDYKYNLSDLGDPNGTHGEYQNAVDFDNDEIIIKYTFGGV